MQIDKPEDIEPLFNDLLNHNPIARNTMMLHRTGSLSKERALMYAVLTLAERNNELTQQVIRLMQERPPSIKPTSGGQ